jgi:peptide deformylase
MEIQVEATIALRYWNDPILSTVCDPVRDSEFGEKLVTFANRLEAKMHEHGGVGLAAPQIGVPIRMFVLRLWETETSLVVCNPTLVFSGATLYEREGCLSVPQVFEQVGRAQAAVMRYFTPQGVEQELALDGMNARIAAHEADHLDGIMFFDRRRISKQMSKAVERAWEKQRAKLKL